MVLNLETDNVGVAVLGEVTHIKEGDIVKRTGKIAQVPVGEGLLDVSLTRLARRLTARDRLKPRNTAELKWCSRCYQRQPVMTHVLRMKAIDAMTPIGRGQRELIIGDRQIGKTAICVDAIIRQKDTGIKCIYVAIVRKSTVAQVVENLKKHDAMSYTCVVACASDRQHCSMLPLMPVAPSVNISVTKVRMH